jgi:hypothetical protein
MLTQERLKEVLSYDPETGIWIWLKPHRSLKIGDRAGFLDLGYRRIGIDGKSYKSSRLAVFYMTGKWPVSDVDHENLQRGDDRWKNLRCATRSQNRANTGKGIRNKSGRKGVYFSKLHNSWRVNIKRHGKSIFIGLYKDIDEAAAAYIAAAKEYFGDFARAE